MPFIEYINQQLNPTFDADMQHAMNWGLAPGFPRVSGMQIASSRQLPWQKTKATPKTAKQAYAPKQSRTAASSGRMQQSKPPSRNIPTLPTPKPQAAPPVAPPMNAQPMGPYMPAFGDEAPGMVALEDAGFAPPMTPQMDLSQAMPFGQQTGLPMEYADMPMPEIVPMQAAPAPVPTTPTLSLGLGRNISPWGTMETYKDVAGIAERDRQFAKGMKVHTPEQEAAASQALGFIGPDGRIMQARAHVMPAAALPMEAAPAVAAGLQGEAFDDELPMPTNPIDRDAMRQQMQAIQMQRDAYEGQMRQERYNNWFRNLGSALSGMGPSTKSFRPAHQAMLNMQRNDANFNNFMRGGMNAQHQLNQDERQLYRDYYNAQHQYNQDVYGRDRALTGRRQADAVARNADTAEKRFGESVRSNKERERLTQEQRDELRRHNQVSEENARNDDMRAMNDSALKAMADAMKMRQQHEDKVADRQSREGIASANRKAASDLFGKKQDAKESGALKGEKRKQLRKFQAVLTKRDKKTDVGAILDAMNSMATQEQYSKAMAQVKASPAYSQARTKEEKYHMFAQALNSMLLDDGPDEEPDNDADD